VCHLALSRQAAEAQRTNSRNLVFRKKPGFSGDLRHTSVLTFTLVATVCLPLVAKNYGADKWTLWTVSTQLRGANIYQRRVYPDLDGDEFRGLGMQQRAPVDGVRQDAILS